MKSTILFLVSVLFLSRINFAQDIVQWKYSTKKIADKTYEVHFTPSVQPPWHIYSLSVADEIGQPTTFYFNKNPIFELKGKVKEIGRQKDFVQVVKLKITAKTNLSGEVEFMACNNKQCLPPETVKFSVMLE